VGRRFARIAKGEVQRAGLFSTAVILDCLEKSPEETERLTGGDSARAAGDSLVSNCH
jgi:hypothetical protein